VRTIFIATTLSFLFSAASADEMTMACQFTSKSSSGWINDNHPFTRVDQVFIDTDKPSFQLRIADTIGTAHEESYGFVNLKAPCKPPEVISDPLKFIIGSQFCGSAFSFHYDHLNHILRVSELYINGGAVFTWTCSP
jgi:hypothetical protein